MDNNIKETMTYTAITKLNSVNLREEYVNANLLETQKNQYAMSLNHEMMRLGYIMSEDLYMAFQNMDLYELEIYSSHIITHMTGETYVRKGNPISH